MPSTAGHILYHAKHRQAIPYTMPCPQGHTIYRHLTSPGHYDILCHAPHTIPCQCDIPCDAHQAIPVTMPCPPDHIICHDITDRPYHIPCHARQAIPYTCHPAKPHHMQYLASQYHIPCHVRKDIPYTMPGPPSNTIYHVMPTKPLHKPCHARKAISYTIPCFPGQTIYHARHAKLYHIPCHTPYL